MAGSDAGLSIEWLDPAADASSPTGCDRRRSLEQVRRHPWLVLLVVLIAVAGTGVWYLTRPEAPLVFTVNGQRVVRPSAVIAQADARFTAYVNRSYGVRSVRSRCYFAIAHGKARTDIAPDLYCGPTLFFGGSTSATYLAFNPAIKTVPGGVALNIPLDPDTPKPVARPPEIKFERPDHKEPPLGADGLRPPPPPPASSNVLTQVEDSDLPALPAMPSTAVIGSLDVRVVLEASGVVARYGQGDATLSAPRGQTMRGFRLRLSDGEQQFYTQDVIPSMGVSVDGGATRPMQYLVSPENDAGLTYFDDDFVVAYPSDAKSLDLVVTDAGITQRLSLLTGAPATGNITVLQRPLAQRETTTSSACTARGLVTIGARTYSTKLSVAFNGATLGYFSQVNNQHASASSGAWLMPGLAYEADAVGNEPNFWQAIPAPDLSLAPDGTSTPIRAHEYADFSAFDVPPSFTGGTITIGGPAVTADGSTLQITRGCSVRFTLGQ